MSALTDKLKFIDTIKVKFSNFKKQRRKITSLYVWDADKERLAGNVEDALDLLHKGMEKYPTADNLNLVLSAVYFDLEQFDESLKYCDLVLARTPDCIAALRRKGFIFEKKGDNTARNRCFRLVHDIDPLDTFWKEEYANVPPEEVPVMELPESLELSIEPEESIDLTIPPEEAINPEESSAENDSAYDLAATLDALEKSSELESTTSKSELEDSLESALDSIDDDITLADVDNSISTDTLGKDVSSAIEDFFGADDDDLLEESAGLEDNVVTPAQTPTESILSLEDSKVEAPTNLDDAFGSLFGEDELPEENAPLASVEEPSVERASNDSSLFEKSAELSTEQKLDSAVAAEAPTNLDDAFGSLFGEDEFPEENAPLASVEEPSVESASNDSSLFEKSAELSTEQKLDSAVAAEAPTNLDDAFGSLFGEDELPEENAPLASAEKSIEPIVDTLATESAVTENEKETAPLAAEDFDFSVPGPALELNEDEPTESLASLVGDVDTGKADLDLDEESSEESLADVLRSLDSNKESHDTVDDAFGSLFGEDELPEETEKEPVAHAEVPDDTAENLDIRVDSQKEQPLPSVDSATKNDIDGAFASLFGEEDDDLVLPAGDLPEGTSDTVEESLQTNPVDNAAKNLNDAVNASFDTLFGEDDDDLVLPSGANNSALDGDETLLPPAASEATLPEARTGAFEALFDVDDDLPEEKSKPQDSVDFLMSGDSDDELSLALLKNPAESLNNNAENIDENLNTRTLAEIYFEQGLYEKSLKIYRDLAEKKPDDVKITARLAEIQKIYDEKFGGV